MINGARKITGETLDITHDFEIFSEGGRGQIRMHHSVRQPLRPYLNLVSGETNIITGKMRNGNKGRQLSP